MAIEGIRFLAKIYINFTHIKETQLVKQITDFLNYRGHLVQRTNSGALRFRDSSGRNNFIKLAHAGTADITGCSKDGRFIAIECKIGKNKPTDLQNAYLEEIKKRGGIARVAYSLDDVVDL
jgi:hypothetical protein